MRTYVTFSDDATIWEGLMIRLSRFRRGLVAEESHGNNLSLSFIWARLKSGKMSSSLQKVDRDCFIVGKKLYTHTLIPNMP
jgi:hypothetical protein